MTSMTQGSWLPLTRSQTRVVALALLLQFPAFVVGDDDKTPIPKVGSCPVGYRTSGHYCIPLESSDKEIIIKLESCPSGYRTSGNYCIKLK
ncbi:hypothetical protein [Halochromatium roseum]|uniref:hypothetical protein n=1 Tax=Halochromatium roseum TaxID=391920 RepID=UPI0019132F01|nr:hypothetical protein [Halochromatium roseum]